VANSAIKKRKNGIVFITLNFSNKHRSSYCNDVAV